MTEQHPLNDEIIYAKKLGYNDDYGNRIFAEWDIRAAADWQLEQVIKYLDSIPKLDIEMYAVYTQITIDIQKAMRPKQQQQLEES